MPVISWEGWVEVARRLSAEVALVVAVVSSFGGGHWLFAALAFFTGLAIYILLPRGNPSRRGRLKGVVPAVVLLDLFAAVVAMAPLAFLLATGPDGDLERNSWALAFSSCALVATSLGIFWVAVCHQCHWILVGETSLVTSSIQGRKKLYYADIKKVGIEVREQFTSVAPHLVYFGAVFGAGMGIVPANTVTRVVVICPREGPPMEFCEDEIGDLPKLVAAIERADRGSAPGEI